MLMRMLEAWEAWKARGCRRGKQLCEHALYLAVAGALLPGFFYYEVCVVLPAVESRPEVQALHSVCAMFLLVNVLGNMLLGMCTDTSIRGRLLHREPDEPGWAECAACATVTPPRAWHCHTCDMCILKRDHHCSFFATCVGYHNYRYFIMFVLHVFVSMAYAFYINVPFIAQNVSFKQGFVLLKFIFPLVHFVWDYNSIENVHVFMLVINVIVGLFTGFLFVYHTINLVQGKTAGENSMHEDHNMYNFGLKRNIIEALGYRWYLTWIIPFISSPLPGNGISWNEKSR